MKAFRNSTTSSNARFSASCRHAFSRHPAVLDSGESRNDEAGEFLHPFVVLAICLIFSLSQAGCTVWRPLHLGAYEPEPVPGGLLEYYDYPRLSIEPTIVEQDEREQYRYAQLEFPLYLPEALVYKERHEWEQEAIEIKKRSEKEARDYRLHYINRLDVFYPKPSGPAAGEEAKRPAIVVSPILGGNMVVDRFAKYFAKHGYVAVIVHRKKPFYDEARGVEQVEDYLRSSVIRIRQAVDWLEAQPEVDRERIGAFGISFGAILHSVVAAVEPRIKYHILSMPAAPLADVIVNCPDGGLRKLVRKAEALGWSRRKIHSELKRVIVTEPLVLAPYVPNDRVVVIAAVFDRVVGAPRTFKLWNAMGRPRLKAMPFGHYGGILVFPYLKWMSLRYFNAKL